MYDFLKEPGKQIVSLIYLKKASKSLEISLVFEKV